MICPDCNKGQMLVLRGQTKEEIRPFRGEMFLENPDKYFQKMPCPRCNGSGIVSFRDGEVYNAKCYSIERNRNRTGSRQIRPMI